MQAAELAAARRKLEQELAQAKSQAEREALLRTQAEAERVAREEAEAERVSYKHLTLETSAEAESAADAALREREERELEQVRGEMEAQWESYRSIPQTVVHANQEAHYYAYGFSQGANEEDGGPDSDSDDERDPIPNPFSDSTGAF